MNIRKTIRHIFGLDLFGVPSAPARKERSGGYRDAPGGAAPSSELERLRNENRALNDERERLRNENKALNEKLKNTLANLANAQHEGDRLRAMLYSMPSPPHRDRIEALRQALADIVTGNANPGAPVPDAYMIRANDALKADDKAKGLPSPAQPLNRAPEHIR